MSIPVNFLAEELSLDKSHFKKYLKKINIPTFKLHSSNSRGQKCLFVTKENAEIVRKNRREEFSDKDSPSKKPVDSVIGLFYIAMLFSNKPNWFRIKGGFSMDPKDRLREYKTIVPEVELMKTWPCKRNVEPVALDAISCVSHRYEGKEIFECEDISLVIHHLDQLFSLLPRPH